MVHLPGPQPSLSPPLPFLSDVYSVTLQQLAEGLHVCGTVVAGGGGGDAGKGNKKEKEEEKPSDAGKATLKLHLPVLPSGTPRNAHSYTCTRVAFR